MHTVIMLFIGIFIGYVIMPAFYITSIYDSKYGDAFQGKITLDQEERLFQDQQIFSSQSMRTATTPQVMKTTKLVDSRRLKIMVTGGAGFVGSHLVDKLMMLGHEVIVVDNMFTGQKKNIAQ